MADLPVEIWQLVRDEEGKDVKDVVLLRDERGRFLPIVIGVCEAAAIWVRMEPELAAPYLRRPWSHDLMQSLLDRLGAKLERVVIDNFTNDTFFATLHIQYRGRELVVDARPSDAIALALRTFSPILVNDEVMDETSIPPGSGEPNEGPEPWGGPS
ncbi:MAG: bifunctional nuclease family protein [Armatimonadota bacterium]